MPATLPLRGHFEIRELHWSLWAEAEEGPRVRGPGLTRVRFFDEPATRELRTVRQLYAVDEHDEDVVAALGQGMRRLEAERPEKAAAVRVRLWARPRYASMADLAAALGVSRPRVTQMANEGQALVERWVRDTYGA